MVAKIQGAQRDFSFGEVDIALKRADEHPARKGGLRQAANTRILNSKAIQNRPGRSALYPCQGALRTERFTIQSGFVYDIQFLPNRLRIINSVGVTVLDQTTQGDGSSLPWVTAADAAQIVFAVLNLTVTITFGHAMRPQVLSFDGVSVWSISSWSEAVTTGAQKRTPFYRLSPQNVTMLPSATRGNITVNFSAAICVAGMVGTRMRYCGRQLMLTGLNSATNMNATVIENLPPGLTLGLASSIGNFSPGDVIVGGTSGATGIVITTPSTQAIIPVNPFTTQFQVGDAITGGTSGATGIVYAITFNPSTVTTTIFINLSTSTAFVGAETCTGVHGSVVVSTAGGTNLNVQLIADSNGNTNFFTSSETVATPSASGKTNAVTAIAPQAVAVWDDEVINSFRGYPASCFSDQFRLGFCDFPAVPGAVGWTAINSPTDLYPGANPSDAIFEIAPGKVRIYHVVAGPESNEFVFCDRRIYYIPISPTNPLKPGSVAFQVLSGDGAAQVQPRLAQEAILYANAGRSSVMAIIATGAYLRPFNPKNLSEFHFHLFNNIIAIAAPSADGSFNERYAYVLNGDGSMAVGKYDADTLPGNDPVIGWVPWTGAAAVAWIGAFSADVIFTSAYFGQTVVEILDDNQYLDCAIPVNNLPAAMAPPAGLGPLYLAAGQSVFLIDQGTRIMGTYQVDANGNIVPQGNGGENLSIASLVAGQSWTMMAEPFVPDAAPGQDVGQRMFPRRVSRFAVYVVHSTGFIMGRLFSGRQTATTPLLGTLMNFRRFPAWNQDDDATKPPLQRETTERIRPMGRAFDPRVVVMKDTPGPLQILELGIEATI